MKYTEYNKKDIVKELQNLKSELGKFPTVAEIRKSNNALANAIYKSGLRLTELRKEIDGNIGGKRPNGYWKNFDNLSSAITPLIKNNVFPSQKKIATISGGAREAIRYFGGIQEVARRMGYETYSFYKASDGHLLRSSLELIVDEFLYSRDINHEIDGIISKDFKYRYDFKIGTTFVEIWGYGGKDYLNRRVKKEKLYELEKSKLISIEQSAFEGDVEKNLQEIFSRFSSVVTRPFDIENLFKVSGFWNDKRILQEIKKLFEKQNRFPTQKDMRDVSGLVGAVQRAGGGNHFREMMGVPPIRLNFWNDETILVELSKVSAEIGKIPTCRDLEKLERFDLRSAILKNKGFRHYQGLLGI
jgi:hypothetical protein